jgi:lysophospholipase L1-like esterase
MKMTSRILSITVLLAMILGSASTASPIEPSVGREVEVQAFYTPTAALAPDGSSWVAWVADMGDDSEIVTSRLRGEVWEPVEVVFANPGRWDASPSLAFDADGVAWLVWASSTGTDDTLHLSHWTGRGWSVPQDVPAWDTVPNRQPVLAPAPGGGLWLAWVGFDGNDDEIYAAFWDGLNWSEPQRVSRDDADPDASDSEPRLAVGPDGSAWLVWSSHEKFLDKEIFAARWDGQQWLAEQQVSDDDDFVNGHPSLAVSEDGVLWVAWHGRVSEDAEIGRRIHVKQWAESAGWSQEMMISSPVDSAVTEDWPMLALDSDGRPHVIWYVADGVRGLGYATFDGANWSSPRWVVQDRVVADGFLMGEGQPLVTWWSDDTDPTRSSESRALEDVSAELPVVQVSANRVASPLIVVNRHLAFGDSITWGQYDDPDTGQLVGDYPARLETLLDTRVVPSEMINDGVPGETTIVGKWRITDDSWPNNQPEFIELMEGTNDITQRRDEEEIAERLSYMVKWMNTTPTQTFLATLPPRQDDRNGETRKLNNLIAEVAVYRDVPLVDVYSAFTSHEPWRALMRDNVHPNTQGMVVLADVFYQSLLDNVARFVEDIIPPTTWIEPLPAQSPCGDMVVKWSGTDNLSYVVDYDVQVQVNSGAWTDWLMATEVTSGTYTSYNFGDWIRFRVRGRDLVGNESDWSSVVSTQVSDNDPPEDVQIEPLPVAQKPPFKVSWSATDACGQIAAFDVEYSVTSPNNWQSWQSATPNTSANFSPASPQYGEAYYFRARARDEAGNWSTWSSAVSTLLARFTMSGDVLTVRHEPVIRAQVTVPGSLGAESHTGGYVAYVANEGVYDLSVARDGFGSLPPMQAISVTADLDGLDFVLPPLDDVVSDGGFEAGVWGDWQFGGTFTPTLVTETHTGDGAVLLGGIGKTSWLSQSLSVPGDLTDATLSFLVQVAEDGGIGDSSTLHVELAGTPISHTQDIAAGGWTHVWFPVEAAVGQAVTLTFTLSDTPAIHLDEVSLGTAAKGGYWVHLPITVRANAP